MGSPGSQAAATQRPQLSLLWRLLVVVLVLNACQVSLINAKVSTTGGNRGANWATIVLISRSSTIKNLYIEYNEGKSRE